MGTSTRIFALLLAIGFFASPLSAVETKPAVFNEVGVVERIGKTVDLSTSLVNESGKSVALSTFFNQSSVPVIVVPMYYTCPMLCQLIADGLVAGINKSNLKLGQDFRIVSVSISPNDTPESAIRFRSSYTAKLDPKQSKLDWHFLTGSTESVHKLTDSVGYYFKPDENGEIAHQAAIIILSPNGKIVRYLYGIEFKPRDLSFALKEAKKGKGQPTIDQLILYCYKYDSASRSYALQAVNVMRLGGLVTIVFIGFIIFGLKLKKK